MLRITIPAQENWDESKEEFIVVKEEQTLLLEHSLVSLSKWESKWHKPFSKSEKSFDEIIDYIKCMTITPNVEDDVYLALTNKNLMEIDKYINDPMTATTFSDDGSGSSREIITAELIYYNMVNLNIPFECEKWHLNRLLTLIKVCNIKSQPQKNMGRSEILQRNAALNADRRRKLNTKG